MKTLSALSPLLVLVALLDPVAAFPAANRISRVGPAVYLDAPPVGLEKRQTHGVGDGRDDDDDAEREAELADENDDAEHDATGCEEHDDDANDDDHHPLNDHFPIDDILTRSHRTDSLHPSSTSTTAVGTPQATIATSSRSTTTSSAAPSSTAGADVRTLALNEHNRFRALHNASALVWSQTLADAAAKWAANCVFEHSQGAVGSYGENLAATAGYPTTIVNGACQPWEAEASEYDPNNPVYSHFTQMVWKGTTELGCVQQICPPGSIFDAAYGNATFYVCEYNPPGNVYPASNFRANVQ
ncbi:hypothetical protein JCM5296_005292 [Sporobolomyces johnsonii]